MFNVAVINLKKLLIKLLFLIVFVLLFTIIFKFKKIEGFEFKSHVGLISSNIRIIASGSVSNYNRILNSELGMLTKFEREKMKLEDELISEENELQIYEENAEKDIVQNIIDVPITYSNNIEVIETKNKKEVFTNVYGSVKVKNESKYILTDEMIMPTVDFNNKKDIIIFHTHTCESYTPTLTRQYVATSNYRTTDQNNSVVRVGNVLTDLLTAKGYNVRHNKAYHDYPSYNGSYNRSYVTVSNMLAPDDLTEFVIDLHRDALGNGSDYGPAIKINDEVVAQLMFVIGTDGGGLEHPNWLNNFKLAVKIQEKANELYPGLFRPIILRNSRYNQNLASGACIIEVGATANTLDECEASMKYLANVIEEIMR